MFQDTHSLKAGGSRSLTTLDSVRQPHMDMEAIIQSGSALLSPERSSALNTAGVGLATLGLISRRGVLKERGGFLFSTTSPLQNKERLHLMSRKLMTWDGPLLGSSGPAQVLRATAPCGRSLQHWQAQGFSRAAEKQQLLIHPSAWSWTAPVQVSSCHHFTSDPKMDGGWS